MRTIGNNSDVISAFFDPEAEGPYKNGTESIYWDDKQTLYSYGRHFPLAYKHHNGQYLFNGDVYSVTTSKHQSDTASHRDHTRGDITISFSALAAAGINYRSKGLHIIASEADQSSVFDWDFKQSVKQVLEAAEKFKLTMPRGATMTWTSYTDPATYGKKGIEPVKHKIPYHWHRPPAAVLKVDAWTETRTVLGPASDTGENQWIEKTTKHPDRFYLLGMDEGSYFISELPDPAPNVKAAYDLLKPAPIIDAESRGLEIKRQGEWFFFRILNGKPARAIYKQLEMSYNLTDASNREGAAHTATRGARLSAIAFDPDTKAAIVKALTYIDPNQLVVSGSITHSEGDHARLKLSLAKDPAIFAAHVNTAIASFSASGSVD